MSSRKCVSHKVLVGLEIHVQLATKSKMFSAVANTVASNGPADSPPEPNSCVDPVILGLPGVLPVINRRAVEFAIMTGLALGCEIARFTKWDRKSYYYPDLPKNYQISQYDLPLCAKGRFVIVDDEGNDIPVRIRRAHLEEDAGKLLHEAPGGYAIDHSIVDLNRAGTPLLEIVTEPDLATPRQVAIFAQELQKLVQFLGVSQGQMQMGHMRFEPNINVHITDADGQVHKTAITEVKNLNSFSVLEKAVAYEVKRQIETWETTGDLGRKCTCGWDDARQATFIQREKEEAHDYRYFPDPDLLPVIVSDAWLTEIKSQIGELPQARRKRYIDELKLTEKDAALLASDRASGDLFDAVVRNGVEVKRAATLMEALREIANDRSLPLAAIPVRADFVAGVGKLVQDGKLAASKEIAKQILLESINTGSAESAEAVATKLGLIQSTDTGPIDAAIDALIAQNPKPLQDYKAGKASAMGALVGMVMKSGKGLNAKIVQERLKEKLG